MTANGLALIEAEIAGLQAALADAAGDEANRPRLLRDLRYWQARRGNAQTVAQPVEPEEVVFGVRVTIRRGGVTRSFRIVGEDEADPARALLGYTAPLAVALQGAGVGDVVELGGSGEPVTVLAIEA